MSGVRDWWATAVARRPGSRPDARSVAIRLGLVGLTLAAATTVIALLEGPPVGLPDASPVYFVAIVLVGSLVGTWPALAAAVGAFIVYDLLFTEPRLAPPWSIRGMSSQVVRSRTPSTRRPVFVDPPRSDSECGRTGAPESDSGIGLRNRTPKAAEGAGSR